MRPDFSKEGLKRFFLYHTEKIILGVSILLMGLFFWLGFNAQPFKDKSPTDLIGMADRAEQYVTKSDSWEQIRELDARKGETDLVQRIQVGNEAIQVSNYPFGFWSIRNKTLSTRKDPQLIPAKDLVATHFVAPLFFTPTNLRKDAAVEDPLSEIPLVSEALASDSPPPRRGVGRGLGDETDGGRGDQRGGMPDGGEGGSSTRSEDEKMEVEVGDRILAIHKQTLPGIRPAKWELSNETESVLLDDVVVVTGLVNVKDLKRNFNESFSDAVGYLPSRDKPAFKYLEVQRAEVGDAEPQWVDISEQISRLISATPKSLTVMPNSEFPSAPEIVDPSSFDPVITQPIPAFTQFDYRKIANHPTLAFRTPEALKGETKAEVVTDIFANDEAPDSEEDAELAEEKVPIRLGSDTAKYAEALTARKLKNDYKLVRFFDLSRKETGKQYQYRVRFWVSDPNNVQAGGGQMAGALGERGESASRGGGRAPGGRPAGGSKNMATGGAGGNMSAGDGLGAGKGRGAQEGEARGGGTGRGGPGRGDAARGGAGGAGRAGSGQEANEDAGYAAVEITPQMKDPEVRARLSKAEEKKDEKDKTKVVYFVQEPGYEELVQVPKGRDDLRFCRPSAWSEPVKVVINPQPRGDVIAGNVEKPRTIRFGTFELSDGEPLIDLVVAPWDRTLRAMLPGRKKAYRGEALDFVATAHVLNPLSWLVHKLDNAPIFSQTVMVDLMGGSELALPKDDVMRYHTAAEMLIMEPDGSLKVTNDLTDRTKYKQALLLPDDPKEFGKPREKKQEEDERGSEFGGRGR